MTAVATESRQYHIGLAQECPISEATAGGVRLHRRTEKVTVDGRGNTKRDSRPGQVVTLPPDRHAKLLAAVSRLAIRRRLDKDGNCVEWRIVMVGERRELAGYQTDLKDNGDGTKTVNRIAIYETKTYDVFDNRTDEPLAPYVFVDPVDHDPFAAQPQNRLETPAWAKALEDPKADVQFVKTGETNTATEQPKPRRARPPAE